MKNNNLDQKGDLIDSLHEAFEDESRWPGWLASLCQLGGGQAAVLTPRTAGRDSGPWLCCGLSQQAVHGWHEKFRHIDPWLVRTQLPNRGAHIVYGGSFPRETGDDNLYAREFLEPNNLGQAIGAWFCPDAALADPYCLQIWRDASAGPFEEAFIHQFTRLTRALERLERISVANALSRTARLGEPDVAGLLLDQDGGVVIANEPAVSMIDKELIVKKDRPVSISCARTSVWIHEWLREVGRVDSIKPESSGERREEIEGHGRVGISLARLNPIGAAPSMLGVRFGLTIRKIGSRSASQLARLAQKRYRWTVAEVDTVRRLTDGQSLPDIADARGCSLETVRSHIKNAKRKAGVNRQVELVRLMLIL